MTASGVFTDDFLAALRSFIGVHHSIYPRLPPQGIYFEALVERAFREIKKPFTVVATTPNQPTHDLLVEGFRVSIKTETGHGTDADQISITKLCTTEREPWSAEILTTRVMDHLSRYDVILMLRAIWKEPLLHYQMVEIPIDLLKLIETAVLKPVGRRKGRQSLGADVYRDENVAFHVHFDGSDGKCQVRNLQVKRCVILREWDREIRD